MSRFVYIGTYTEKNAGGPGKAEGIYIFRMDPSSGVLQAVGSAVAGPNPSYLAIHPKRQFLYATNELDKGAVSALAMDQFTGALTLLNSQPSDGSAPCYVSLDPSGRWLFTANYGSGNLAVFPVLDDGRLGPHSDLVQHRGKSANPQRQEGPHAHSILFDPSGRFILAADLGIDRVLVYRLDAVQGRLIPNDPSEGVIAPGSGPRHMAFSPSTRYLFVANEVDSSITMLQWDSERGALQPIQTQPTLPAGFKGENSVADIHVAPSGRYVYVSNRGHNSLAIFGVDERKGSLIPGGHVPTGGGTPRNFAIDPFGAYLLAANQTSHNVVAFRLDPVSGQPVPTGQVYDVPSPVCVKMIDWL